MMEGVISEETDLLDVEYELVQVEKSDNEQNDIDDCNTLLTSKKN